jgi:predicted DCC family thiol-disulfide oxidoreductase YuxK
VVRDDNDRLVFRDIRDPSGGLPVTQDQAEASMWVRDEYGRLLEGFFAWRRILDELPGWRWFGRLTQMPPFRWLGPLVYRFIANNRNVFGAYL